MSLNNVSQKMFKFDSNMFHRFKDRFFKVKATNVTVDGLLLMQDKNGEPHFPFYWQSEPTRFKSFDECLMSQEERMDKAFLK